MTLYILVIIITATGKLPVEVDMNWIPQPQVERADSSNIYIGSEAEETSPPRIPPKMNESARHLAPNIAVVPALPPKPKAF